MALQNAGLRRMPEDWAEFEDTAESTVGFKDWEVATNRTESL